MQKIYYFTQGNEKVLDGGSSRDSAFLACIKQLDKSNLRIISLSSFGIKNKILSLFKCIYLFLTIKNSAVLLHQNFIFSVFSGKLLNISPYRSAIFFILNVLTKNNRLIVEINDLRFEQAIDFGIRFDRAGYLGVQRKIFQLKNAEFIFASNGLRNLSISHYGVSPDVTYTIINGGILRGGSDSASEGCSTWISKGALNCVYAGGLIQGRQILEMVELFRDMPNVNLLLMGGDGDWLKEYPLPNNIKFMGNLPEALAHQLVERCDLGLIPYDDTLSYYNLCYPTKASFYATAGTPFLCTCLDELMETFKGDEFAIFLPFNQWSEAIKKLDKQNIQVMKAVLSTEKVKYAWESILAPLEAILYKS